MPRFFFFAVLTTALGSAVAGAAEAGGQSQTQTQTPAVAIKEAVPTSSHPGQCWHYSDWIPMCAAESCATTGDPIVATPAREDRLRAAVARPLPQKMSVSGDALFAFGKSELQAEGKALLAELAGQLLGATYSVISVTGHADRLGDSEYNQKLSERRAVSVKEYLVSKDVLESRIDAEGKGATQPVTRVGECRGAKSPTIVTCLQPDRRVDVEMHGIEPLSSSQ